MLLEEADQIRMWNGDEQDDRDCWNLQHQTQDQANQDIAVNRPGDFSMYLGLTQQPAPSPHARRDTVGSPPKYEKVEFVGRGSFGEAWKVKSVNSGREYVLKTLHMRGLTEKDMKRGSSRFPPPNLRNFEEDIKRGPFEYINCVMFWLI